VEQEPDGGIAATDWAGWSVDRMWAVVSGHDPAVGDSQSAAWHDASELVESYRRQVKQFRDQVDEAWRPDGSQARALFFGKIDELLAALDHTRDTSASTGSGLSHYTASMSEARTALEPVHTGAQEVDQMTSDASRDPMSLASARLGLHNQAVGIMTTLSSHAMESYTAMAPPPPYQPPAVGFRPGEGSHPSLPPFAPGEHGDPLPSHTSTALGSPGVAGGPLLSGVSVPPQGSGPVPPTLTVPTLTVPPLTVPPLAAPGGGAAPGRQPAPEVSPFYTPRKALPIGGLIGGQDWEGVVDPPGSTPPFRTVNPIGEIVGRTVGNETDGLFAPPAGGAAGRAGQRQQRRRIDPYRTNEHWPQPKGVPPVIEPTPERPHDPGPIHGPHP
jgi:hypothetical protein